MNMFIQRGVVCNQCNFIAFSFYGNCYCNVVVDLASCLSDKGNKFNGFFSVGISMS